MKNSVRIIVISFLLLSIGANAQQEGNLSMFHKHMNPINPAYAGAEGKTSLTSSIRSQWQGIKDAPESQVFSFGIPVGKKLGLGISFGSDKVFIEKQTALYIDASYLVQLSEGLKLYFGLKAGGDFYNIDLARLDDINNIDASGISNQNNFNPNVGVGVYLKHKSFYLSLSSPKILSTERIKEEEGIAVLASSRTHLYLSGGYTYMLSSKFALKPYVMTRYVSGAPFSGNFVAAIAYNEAIEVGFDYGTDDIMGGFLAVEVEKWLGFGYSYANSTKSELSATTGGIHEIFVKFNF